MSQALRVLANQAPVLTLVLGDSGRLRYKRFRVAGFDEALNGFHMTQLQLNFEGVAQDGTEKVCSWSERCELYDL